MIRKMTSLPAKVYDLKGKGYIREGFDADICIFDSEKIIDNATFAFKSLIPLPASETTILKDSSLFLLINAFAVSSFIYQSAPISIGCAPSLFSIF